MFLPLKYNFLGRYDYVDGGGAIWLEKWTPTPPINIPISASLKIFKNENLLQIIVPLLEHYLKKRDKFSCIFVLSYQHNLTYKIKIFVKIKTITNYLAASRSKSATLPLASLAATISVSFLESKPPVSAICSGLRYKSMSLIALIPMVCMFGTSAITESMSRRG